MATPAIGYQISAPDRDGSWIDGLYQHAEIRIYLADPANPEDGYRRILVLRYQRDRDRQEKRISHWYGESIGEIGESCGEISRDLTAAAKLVARLDRTGQRIRDQGLRVASGDDALLYRERLLDLSGAVRVHWDTARHGTYAYGGA